MKILVTGTRGIPGIAGGVEKHCEELYPRICALGHEVILVTRSPYVARKLYEWRGVKLINYFAPRKKNLESIVHTFMSVLKARSCNPDILHIHAIGPGLLVPVARMLGLKVVITNHGPDYDRVKWGRMAKFMLRLGEYFGGRFANEVIVVSSVISDIIKERCNRRSNLIYNGVSRPERSKQHGFLTQIGARPNNYVLAVARFVPEKGLHDLIGAFRASGCSYKLVISGDADHETAYSRNLRRMASVDDRVILTGYITGEPLNQVYANARLFVLPSYHEGLPIALLEALGYGLSVLVSDIPANKEVELPAERYFRCGDVGDLKEKMEILLKKGFSEEEQENISNQIEEKYNWIRIAEQTIGVYEKALLL
ncbi:MAG: glycosyltransferase family 4 protein [Thermodesulfobacteriota bacterium]|nr:glycosyltransferase family 4 protein [Thermodesulfobacteriota bacterium]